jgi:hypothetical protein
MNRELIPDKLNNIDKSIYDVLKGGFSIGGFDSKELSAEIVRRHNCHTALLEACRASQRYFETMPIAGDQIARDKSIDVLGLCNDAIAEANNA